MEKEYEIDCEDCGTSFTIATDSEEKPEYCPFCGFELENRLDENESEEYENEDEDEDDSFEFEDDDEESEDEDKED